MMESLCEMSWNENVSGGESMHRPKIRSREWPKYCKKLRESVGACSKRQVAVQDCWKIKPLKTKVKLCCVKRGMGLIPKQEATSASQFGNWAGTKKTKTKNAESVHKLWWQHNLWELLTLWAERRDHSLHKLLLLLCYSIVYIAPVVLHVKTSQENATLPCYLSCLLHYCRMPAYNLKSHCGTALCIVVQCR